MVGMKFSDDGKRGRAKIPSPNPLPFCPPEHSVWRAKRAVSSVEKRFGFRQTNALLKHPACGVFYLNIFIRSFLLTGPRRVILICPTLMSSILTYQLDKIYLQDI